MSHVIAEMAATVFKVEAQVGDVVGPDDVVVVLESMKMEIPVLVGFSGKISEISVAEGDMIDEGARIAVVDVS